MSERRDRILDLLKEEFRDGGHTIVSEEGDVYATVLFKTAAVTIPAAKFNLDTLADQIDRRLG